MMLEHVEAGSGPSARSVRLLPPRTIEKGENIVARGAQARKGDELLPAGTAIGAAQVALAAACGCAELEVFVRPARGHSRHRRRACAHPVLARSRPDSQLQRSHAGRDGGRGRRRAVGSARRARHCQSPRRRARQAAEADLLLITGGVSAGKFDLVEPALARAGARFHFTGVRIQPGKPLVFGELPCRTGQRRRNRSAARSAALRPSRQSRLFCRHISALCRAGAGRAGRPS